MDINQLQDFFFWCLIINIVIYFVTAIASLSLRGLLCKLSKRLLNLDEQSVSRNINQYLSFYKLFITVFNFVPWVAILIINK